MDSKYCKKCRSLYYNKKESSESIYIGEGYYVWDCKRYNITHLSCYLDGAKGEDVFRCSECLLDRG